MDDATALRDDANRGDPRGASAGGGVATNAADRSVTAVEGSLAERRRALLARRLRDSGLEADRAAGGVPERPDPARAPLSFAQRHAWRYQQARPGSVANNLGLVLEVRGHLDLDALAEAFRVVAARHEVLRTTIHPGDTPDGVPYQRVHADRPPRLDVVEVAALDAQAQDRRVAELVDEAVTEPFDLAVEVPWRVTLLVRGDGRTTVLMLFQHLVWDGATLAVISDDLRAGYAALCAGREPDRTPVRPSAVDHAAWEQAGWRERPEVRGAGAYWRERLARAGVAPVALPLRHDVPDDPSDRGGRLDRRLRTVTHERLRAVAAAHAATPFAVFLACWSRVLRRAAASAGSPADGPLVIGTLAVDRDRPGLDRPVGNFADPLPLCLDPVADPSFGALVAGVRECCDAAFAHAAQPFLPLVEELYGHDGTGRVPLFDTLVVFVAQDIEGPRLPGVDMVWERADTGAAQFPLVPLGVEVFVREAGVDIQFTYAADLVAPDAMAALLDDLERELEHAVADPPDARL